MQILVRKLTEWAYASNSPVMWLRAERMRAFLRHVRPPAGARIIDLGGTSYMWTLFDHEFDVTLVNLAATAAEPPVGRVVAGDACDLSRLFPDRAFDVVFSNSVIEHVGDETRQEMFAREARRLGRAYWIQTPSDRFPVEAHTGVVYYWRRSERARRRMLGKWRRTLPEWSEMIAGTRVLSRSRMQELFPGSRIHAERVMGLEKSYAAYTPYPTAVTADAGPEHAAGAQNRAAA